MILLYRILFGVLAIAGGFILSRVIPVVARMITEKPVMSLSLTERAATFSLTAAGDFAIWQKTKGFRRTRIDIATPRIVEVSSGRLLSLDRTGAMITSNDGSGTRRQLYRFSAAAPGEYRLESPAGTWSGSRADWSVKGGEDLSGCSLEIRKPMPVLKLILCILSLIAGFAMGVGGIIGITLAGRFS